MSIFEIAELKLFGVYDGGVPNLERIVVQVLQSVNLASYGLMLGVRGNAGSAVPLRDNMLWFGTGQVEVGDWLFIYTAPGETRTTNIPNSSQRIFSLHWGRPYTVFGGAEFVPILFRIGGVQFLPAPLLLPGPQK